MSTKVFTSAVAPTLTGTSQTVNITEGTTVVPLNAYSLSTTSTLASLTLIFTQVSGINSIIDITSTGLNIGSVSVVRNGGVITITSQDHAALNRFIGEMSAVLTADANDMMYTIKGATEAAETAPVTLTINVDDVVDATDINQTHTLAEDAMVYYFRVNPPFVYPQVDDQLGPDSGRTYRVTYRPLNSNSQGKYVIFVSNSQGVQFSDTVVFTGDQNTVNDLMANPANGFHFDFNLDFNGQIIVEYVQEVLTGATGAPYVQEIGQIVFNITPDVDGGATILPSHGGVFFEPFNFLPVTVTDSAALWPARNAVYQIKLTLDESFASISSTVEGLVWDDNTRTATYTGTRDQVNAISDGARFFAHTSSNENQVDMLVEVFRSVQNQPYTLLKSQTATFFLSMPE